MTDSLISDGICFQLVTRPDVVEMHDVTARDPKLLVSLKATRNSVPVPRHWCFKRKYLQGKRGIEKPPFELPEFIKATGIMEMRQALQEKVCLAGELILLFVVIVVCYIRSLWVYKIMDFRPMLFCVPSANVYCVEQYFLQFFS